MQRSLPGFLTSSSSYNHAQQQQQQQSASQSSMALPLTQVTAPTPTNSDSFPPASSCYSHPGNAHYAGSAAGAAAIANPALSGAHSPSGVSTSSAFAPPSSSNSTALQHPLQHQQHSHQQHHHRPHSGASVGDYGGRKSGCSGRGMPCKYSYFLYPRKHAICVRN